MAKGNIFTRLVKKAASNYYVTVVQPASDRWVKIFGDTPNLSDTSLISNFETIPDLFLITDYIARTVANIPVKVVKASGKEAKNSELWKLIEEPNQYQSWSELIKLSFGYYELLGNAYLYGPKPDAMNQVTSLYCLPTDKTRIVLARDKTLPAWMNEIARYQVVIGGKEYNLDPAMVLHERYFSLRYDDGSWVYGISKYIPADKVTRELKAIHDAKISIVAERGAVGFITNESEMPDPEQSKEVKEKLQTQYGVLEGQDKIIVTTEKLRWQQMALGVQELQLIENAKYSFAKMCQINGFDPVIFSTEGSTFANKAEAVKEMMLKVIKPKVESFYTALSTWIAPGYAGDRIMPDWSQVEELQADRKAMTELLEKQIGAGIITPYKAAQMLYGDEVDNNPPPDLYYLKSSLKLATEVTSEEPEINPDLIRQMAEENGN